MEALLFLSLNPETWIGLTIGTLIMFALISFLVVYKILAPRNIFFTFGRENYIMEVMNGKKFSGKVILPSKTLYIDRKNYDIKKFEDLPRDYPKILRDSLKRWSFLGMYWVGIYPFRKIHFRHQQWLEWKSTATGREIQFRDEMTPYLIAKPFEYALLLVEAEDMFGLPLNVYFTLIVVPTNAIRPIFENDDAYGQLQTICLGEALLFVKEKSFATVGGGNTLNQETKDEFSNKICEINNKIPGRIDGKGIIQALGYQILDAKLDQIKIVGENQKILQEASTAKYVADQKALADIAEADGRLIVSQRDAQGMKAKFDVQREYYQAILNMPGGREIEMRKATPNLTTLVEGNTESKTSLLINK